MLYSRTMLQNKKKREVQLPATKKSRNHEVGADSKGKRSYLDAMPSWRMGDSLFQISFPLQNPDKNLSSSAGPEQKAVPRIPASFQSTILWSLRQLLSGHPGSLACSQLLSGFRLPPGGCVWSWHGHDHVAVGARRSRACGRESM